MSNYPNAHAKASKRILSTEISNVMHDFGILEKHFLRFTISQKSTSKIEKISLELFLGKNGGKKFEWFLGKILLYWVIHL